MIVKSIAFLLVVCVAIASSHEEDPGENTEYRCDIPCEKSCTNRDILVKCVSTQVCKYFCKPGYFRDAEDRCVREEQCPQCGENETYKSEGIDCQTCRNHQFVRCALIKEYRCYCLPNHVRNDQGVCTPTEECPKNDN